MMDKKLKVLEEVEVLDFIEKLTEKRWSFVDGYRMLLDFVGVSAMEYRQEYDKEGALNDFDFHMNNKVIDTDGNNLNNKIGDFYISYSVPGKEIKDCIDIEDIEQLTGGYWSVMFNGDHSMAPLK